MDRCPICRGRMNDEAQCKRCGADLCSVIQAHNEAEGFTLRAVKLLENNEYTKAEDSLKLALALEYTPVRSQMLAFICYELASSKRKTTFLHRIAESLRGNA